MRYPKKLKGTIIAKMLPPNNQSLSSIQQETGVPEGTLKLWRKEIRGKGFAAPSGEKQSDLWSTRDKYLIVVETSTLPEIELAEYCRKKGLYVEQVKSCCKTADLKDVAKTSFRSALIVINSDHVAIES